MSYVNDFNSLYSIEDQFDIKELTRKPDTEEIKKIKSDSKDAYHNIVRMMNIIPDYKIKRPVEEV